MLPFGLSVVPYCFTKIVGALVKFSVQIVSIVAFIDDGAGAKRIFRRQVLVQNLSSSHC